MATRIPTTPARMTITTIMSIIETSLYNSA